MAGVYRQVAARTREMMDATDPTGFPWGKNQPTRKGRILVASLLALAAGANLYFHYRAFPRDWSDFTQIWFGANAILHGADPYTLTGPGKVLDIQWPLLYPATSFFVAMPFAWLTHQAASIAFTVISVFLLAYGATQGSWHRLPMFASIAFVNSIQLAQWSILMTAAVFLPWLAVFAASKPQAALPSVIANKSRVAIIAALVGALFLTTLSLVFLPSWPRDWVIALRTSEHLYPPVGRLGGFLIFLCLLRWKRWEAWLVLVSACMPHTWAWYNVLILLSIAATYREACVLSLVSSGGKLAGIYFIGDSHSMATFRAWGALMVATAYLPATIAVLRRPNDWDPPSWVRLLLRKLDTTFPRHTSEPSTNPSTDQEPVPISTHNTKDPRQPNQARAARH